MLQRPVIIEDYNVEWPTMFSEIETILKAQLGALAVSIEHVGSTSVPGLAAKPILDIDIIINSMEELPDVIHRLAGLGYSYEGNRGVEDREAFRRKDSKVPYNIAMNEKLEQHVYVCSRNSAEFKRHRVFRDALRRDPLVAKEYGMLKKELADQFTNNRIAYTEGKTDFVNRILNRASLSCYHTR